MIIVYLMAILSIALGSFAQLFLKIGAKEICFDKDQLGESLRSLISNYYLWGGLAFYGLSVVFWLFVLSKLELSRAYPLVSIGYIFTLFLGNFFLQESMTVHKILGVCFIIIGVIFISRV